jgi:two-component system, chemotaxis family, chemotaxis protein CheY
MAAETPERLDAAPLPVSGSYQVLVVDDAAGVRHHVARTLEAAGFSVVTAADGPSALLAIRDNPALTLVFLDFNMPGMNGLAVLQWIRQRPELHDLPAVMLTTESAPSLVKRARSLGASAWLVKPPKEEHLVMVAKKLAVSRGYSGE